MILKKYIGVGLPEKPEDPENTKDSWTTGSSQGYGQIYEGNEDQKSIHNIPTTFQVCMRADEETFGKNLENIMC